MGEKTSLFVLCQYDDSNISSKILLTTSFNNVAVFSTIAASHRFLLKKLKKWAYC